MADFSQIEQNYINDPGNKVKRDAYKIVLIARIDKDRTNLCQSYSNFKSGLSPSKIWQNLLASGTSNSALVNKLIDIIKLYPYLSLHAGKSLFKLGKIGGRSKLLRVFAIIAVVKLITFKVQKRQAKLDQSQSQARSAE